MTKHKNASLRLVSNTSGCLNGSTDNFLTILLSPLYPIPNYAQETKYVENKIKTHTSIEPRPYESTPPRCCSHYLCVKKVLHNFCKTIPKYTSRLDSGFGGFLRSRVDNYHQFSSSCHICFKAFHVHKTLKVSSDYDPAAANMPASILRLIGQNRSQCNNLI